MDFKIDGNKLTITCQLSQGSPSRSGKTLIVASTNGFTPVEGTDIRISLNVIKSKK